MTLKLAITMGDPAGIGPEILAKALSLSWLETHAVVVVGVESILREAFQRFNPDALELFKEFDPAENFAFGLRLKKLPEPDVDIPKASVSATAGKLALESIKVATEMCLAKEVDAMVTTPVSKEAIERNGIRFDGHTGYIAKLCGVSNEMMMMSHAGLNIGYVTTHLPLAKVPQCLTESLVLNRLRLSWEYLKSMKITPGKMALCGLNPHAGEGGHMGREEIEILGPALQKASQEGIVCEGPYPSDTLFVERFRKEFGVILALYHDQGGIPFKMLAFDHGVNHTLGLPIIRTSVDHGTAWDIAWQGKASELSLISAMEMACIRVGPK